MKIELMNEVLIQLWEESEENGNNTPVGCSLHLNYDEHKNYMNSIANEQRSLRVPVVYEICVGLPVSGYVTDVIFSILEKQKTVRLQQYEMNNLVGLKELEIEND